VTALFLAGLFGLGVISGATAAVVGFGIGSLLTPLLLMRLTPSIAVAVVALPHLVATALRYVQHRTAIDRRVVVRFGVPSAMGGAAGAWLQGELNEAWLFAVLGVLLIMTAAANLTGGFGGWKPSGVAAGLLGVLSGIFGGLVGNQGGLRAAGLLAFDLAPRAYLATGTTVALMIDAARTPIYLARAGDALAGRALPITVAAAGCVVGTIIGERLFLGLSPDRYRYVIGCAVGVLGAWLLTQVWA
jgi:uncharacterized membrane protein YfcA